MLAAAEAILAETGAEPGDFAYAVFHQPNVKFPSRAGKILGFSREQIETGLLCGRVGNVYAGSSLLGLSAVLDVAKPGDRILMVSYGSGAGSDAMILRATDLISERQGKAPATEDYIARRTEIDYATYTRYRNKLRTD